MNASKSSGVVPAAWERDEPEVDGGTEEGTHRGEASSASAKEQDKIEEQDKKALYNLLRGGPSFQLAEVIGMTMAMAVVETDSPAMLLAVVTSAGILLCLNVYDAVHDAEYEPHDTRKALAVTAVVSCGLLSLAVLFLFRQLVRQTRRTTPSRTSSTALQTSSPKRKAGPGLHLNVRTILSCSLASHVP